MDGKQKYKTVEKLELKDISPEFPQALRKIECPSCNSEISVADISLDKEIAKCNSCNGIFSIAEDVSHLKPKKKKHEIIRPEGIDLFYFQDGLDITVTKHLQGLDAFGIITFPTLAAFAIFISILKPIPISIPVVLTLASIYFIYRAMTYSKNKIYLDVNKETITVKHMPNNFQKEKVYNSREIDQVYVGRDTSGYFSLNIIINGIDGQKHQKLFSVKTMTKGKFLEQEIEKHLGIEDRSVPEALG